MGPAEPEKNYFEQLGPSFSCSFVQYFSKKHVESGGGGGEIRFFENFINKNWRYRAQTNFFNLLLSSIYRVTQKTPVQKLLGGHHSASK